MGAAVGSRTGQNSGFTLVELLVALCILSIVASGTYMAFSTGLRLRKATQDRMHQVQSERQLRATLRDDLFNLSPLKPCMAVQENSMSLLRHPRRAAEDPSRGLTILELKEPDALLVTYCSARRVDGSEILVRQERPLYVSSHLGGLERILEEAASCDSAEAQDPMANVARTVDVGRWLDAGMTLYEGCEGLSIVPLQEVTEDLVEGPYGVQDETRALDITPLRSDVSEVSMRGGSDVLAGGRPIGTTSVPSLRPRGGRTSSGRSSEDAESWRIILP